MTDQAPTRRDLMAFAPLLALVGVVTAGAAVLLSGRERVMVTDEVAGRPTPPYDFAPLVGEERVTPARFAGRAYLINLFASWCAPCRVEHPHLMALAASGVPILGIAYKDTPEATTRFLADLGDPFEVVGLDPDGAYGLDLGVAGVPETFVVGSDGRLITVFRGPLTEAIVAERIVPALQRGVAA